jgi:L-2-hydroxyglutarate oxidase LhgO
MTDQVDLAVIGGGIVGLATAHQFVSRNPSATVAVLEQEPSVGRHQSSRNSGVLHAGLYYRPGSLKAELCHRGKQAMEDFARRNDIPVEHNGKLVVATDDSEIAGLEALAARARANGTPGLRMLDRDELRDVEPNVTGVRALHSPTTAVIDFGAVCEKLASSLDVRTNARVMAISETSGSVRIASTSGDVEAKTAVVCAGLWSSALARSAGIETDVRIVPFKGTWTALRPSGAALVHGNIYPVPNPELPFLGVHLTRRIDGSVWAGPNAVLSLADRAVAGAALRFPGTWRLAAREVRTAMRELWLTYRHRPVMAELNRYVPGLRSEDVDWSNRPSGVRAQAVRRDGTLVDDFVIQGAGRALFVLNAPSPAATASLAIGDMLATQAGQRTGS